MSTSTSYRSNCFNLEISLPSNKPERNKWPNGLSILEDFITDEEHEELVNFIRQYSSTSFTRIGWLLASDSCNIYQQIRNVQHEILYLQLFNLRYDEE